MDWANYDIPQTAWSVFDRFYDCWERGRGPLSHLPGKASLCPACLGTLSQRFMLVERSVAGDFSIRLVADGLRPHGSPDITGRTIFSLFKREMARQIALSFERCRAMTAGAYHDFTITLSSGDRLEGDALFLPYTRARDGTTVDFFGAVFTIGEPGDELLYASSRPVRFAMGDIVFIDMGRGCPSPRYEFLSALNDHHDIARPSLVGGLEA